MCACCCPVCELAPCDSSVTVPSFLLFSNPSCTGQHTARASISAPSPAYLSDTQVGTAHPTELFRSTVANISFSPPYVLVFFITLLTELVLCLLQNSLNHHPGARVTCWGFPLCCHIGLLCCVRFFFFNSIVFVCVCVLSSVTPCIMFACCLLPLFNLIITPW